MGQIHWYYLQQRAQFKRDSFFARLNRILEFYQYSYIQNVLVGLFELFIYFETLWNQKKNVEQWLYSTDELQSTIKSDAIAHWKSNSQQLSNSNHINYTPKMSPLKSITILSMVLLILASNVNADSSEPPLEIELIGKPRLSVLHRTSSNRFGFG